jgi:hypothetical protein
MAASLPQQVHDHAAGRCEFGHLPQAASNIPFEIDHITARKYHGRTIAGNLALAWLPLVDPMSRRRFNAG